MMGGESERMAVTRLFSKEEPRSQPVQWDKCG